MLFTIYLIPLAAWAAFVYHMHHSGGRPTTYVWWAFMTGLGTFELGKGIAGEVGTVPAVTAAFCAGLFAAGVVLVIHARRTWIAGSAAGHVEALPTEGR
jgi:hypothetical protein